MNLKTTQNIRIIELTRDEAVLRELKGRYLTSEYYDLVICRESKSWKVELALEPLEKTLEKSYTGRFFADFVEEARVFEAISGDKRIGWIELGYQKWNNRMRVWEFFVEEGFRRMGVGTLLMEHAVKVAKEKGARMLVLETQTCNTSAIDFYVKFGFELIGFDAAAYSNEDIARKEVRLEMGLRL